MCQNCNSLGLGSDLRPALRSQCLLLVQASDRNVDSQASTTLAQAGRARAVAEGRARFGGVEGHQGGLLERGSSIMHPVGDVMSPLSISWKTGSAHGREGELV